MGFIAKIFGTTLEKSIMIIIGLLIFVFEPLAIALILAGNFLLDRQNKKAAPLVVEESKDVLYDPIVSYSEIEEIQEEEIQEEPVVESPIEKYDEYGFAKREKTIDSPIFPNEKISVSSSNKKSEIKHFYE